MSQQSQALTPDDGADDLADDVLWGVSGPSGIAAYLKKKPPEVYYLISIGALRGVKKHSHRIITGSKRALRQQFMSD
jgi:hypothetical protein